MTSHRIVIKWEVSSAVQCMNLIHFFMCGRLQRQLFACRHGEGYLAPGRYERDAEHGDGPQDPICFQVRPFKPGEVKLQETKT